MKRKKILDNKELKNLLKRVDFFYSKPTLFPEPEPKDLTEEEIKQCIVDTKEIINRSLFKYKKTEDFVTEAKRVIYIFRGYGASDNFCDTSEIYNLIKKYKSLKLNISNEKKRLTILVQDCKFRVHSMNVGSLQKIDLVIPECIEYLEEEYSKIYNMLDEKTKIISKKEKELKEEVKRIEQKEIEDY